MKILPLLLLIAIQTYSQSAKKIDSNPFIGYTNSPLQLDKLTVEVLEQASAAFYKIQGERIKLITSVPKGTHNFTNSLAVFDKIQAANNEWMARNMVISYTSTSEALRDKASSEGEKINAFSSNIFLNRELYLAVANFAASYSSKKLLPDQKKYLEETLFAFEKNGMKFSESSRKEVAVLNERVSKLEAQFGNNIFGVADSLLLNDDDVRGIPPDVSKRWKKSGDSYIVQITEMNYRDVMKYADKDSIRHRIYLHYKNRAYPANSFVLDSMLYYRQLLATKLGFSSYASYKLADKMAANSQNVWNFLDDLVNRLKPAITSNINELRRIKKKIQRCIT